MEKAKEIEILQSLKGDTYFNDTFSSEDIDRMCNNIKSDFPLDLSLDYGRDKNAQIQSLENELKNEKKRYADAVEALVAESLNIAYSEFSYVPQALYDEYVNWVGIKKIISIKNANDIPITKDEVGYLLSLANG